MYENSKGPIPRKISTESTDVGGDGCWRRGRRGGPRDEDERRQEMTTRTRTTERTMREDKGC